MMAVWDDYKWKFWDTRRDPLPDTPNNFRKISICTTCMGRLRDLRETLLRNINDNADYPDVEFVVLDYNSGDGLGDWIATNMQSCIDSGRLVYYRTAEPKYYNMGHSRNVAFKLATGDIVNNVDADNFTNCGFASVINRMAEIAPEHAVFCKGKRMMHGRIGLYKSDFMALGGYDESLVGYGGDDHNLVMRAMALGYTMMWWGSAYCDRIKTPRREVTANMAPEYKSWRATEAKNKEITKMRLARKEFVVNEGTHWGKATVTKNFSEIISI